MNGFLSIGECMVEMAPAEGGQFRMGYAGDTFNTAWYAARMLPDDWRVGYASAVGDDAVSGAMCDFIAAQGVDTAHIRRLNGKTVGLYMIQLQNGERSFSYWRGQSAARHLADDAPWLDAAFQGQKMLFFSGITLAILPPAARDTLCAALARARANGAHVAFDTNLRPRLWDSADAMRHGLMQGAAVADTILPSFDEEQLAFGDSDPAQTMNRYRAAGATTIALKNGDASCHIWSKSEGELRYDPPPVAQVVDSTAAGDSFGAGFLATRATGGGIGLAVDRAARLAGAVIQRRGALAPDIFDDPTFLGGMT